MSVALRIRILPTPNIPEQLLSLLKLTTMRVLFVLLIGGFLISCQQQGCTDPTAVNYDPNAVVDDGSCLYSTPNQPPSGGIGGNSCDSTLILGQWQLVEKLDGSGNQMTISNLQFFEFIEPMQGMAIDWRHYQLNSWGESTIEEGIGGYSCSALSLGTLSINGYNYVDYDILELTDTTLVFKKTIELQETYFTVRN